MSSDGYFKIMKAAANLVRVIMIEAGRAPAAQAEKVFKAIIQATTGKSLDS